MSARKSQLTRSSETAKPAPAREVKAGRSEHNRSLLARAHQRMNELVEQAEAEGFYGVVSIEATFEAGRINTIRRRIDGTDK